MMSPSLRFWLAIAAIGTFGSGYFSGYQNGQNGCLADQASALKAAIKQAQNQAINQAKDDLKLTQNFEGTRETVRTVYIRIKEKADENIDKNNGYSDCGLDADGLRLYNARPAESVTSPPASGLTHFPLPGSAGSTGRTAGNPVTQQPGKIGAVLRMPDETQGTLRVGRAPGEDR